MRQQPQRSLVGSFRHEGLEPVTTQVAPVPAGLGPAFGWQAVQPQIDNEPRELLAVKAS
jgi:hypothetical protein